MTTTPHAVAAAAARQRLASVLATLQQNPNVPPSVLEILSGLARAMGPLFQLERGNPDVQLFVTARTVLQETLERIQTADQRFPGVAEATGVVAECLGTIFNAMRAAGVVLPSSGVEPTAAAALAFGATQAAPVSHAVPLVQAPQSASHARSAPVNPQPAAVAHPAQPAPIQQASRPITQPHPSGALRAPTPAPGRPAAPAPVASVPMGPNGLPRLESEIGVHSETNFYTDFLGDIRNHGGIFVATFHVMTVGTPCEVLLTFPGDLVAEIRGNVRWKRDNAPGTNNTSSPGLGIEIVTADAKAWDLIHRFIRKREPIMHEM